MRYTVQHRYHSGICDRYELGTLEVGTTIELEEQVADWINRDSAGVLEPVQDAPKAKPRKAEPTQDRQVKASGRTRSKSKAKS